MHIFTKIAHRSQKIFSYILDRYKNFGKEFRSDDFRIEMLVPGYRKEDIRIQYENGILSVSHELSDNQADGNVKYVTREFQPVGFERSFRLSDRLASDKIAAKYENGILEVTIPKKEEAKAKPAREISIK